MLLAVPTRVNWQSNSSKIPSKEIFEEELRLKDEGPSFGVFSRVEDDDISLLVNNYTTPALARALRDRESALQRASNLLNSGELRELRQLLHPFSMENVQRRRRRSQFIELSKGFDRKSLVVLQRFLHRMPRQVFHAAEKRASVVIPLCNINGDAHILFQKRSQKMTHHKGEVCFPGGMVEGGSRRDYHSDFIARNGGRDRAGRREDRSARNSAL